MVCIAHLCFQFLLFSLLLSSLVHGEEAQPRPRKRPNRQHEPFTSSPPSAPPSTQPPSSPARLLGIRKLPVSKRGVPGLAGDIEWMGFYGSLLAVPTMLSILGIQTNYNLEKSYFNSQLNAQYYKQSRELLRAHAAKLTRDQEEKFAKAGVTWPGMMFDSEGQVRSEWGGTGEATEGAGRVARPVTANESGEGGSGGGSGDSDRTHAGGGDSQESESV